MDFIILWTLSTIGAFTVIVTALVVAYIFYTVWREGKEAKQQAQAELERRVSEPLTLSPKVVREIIDILDGDDYEWAWRDAI